MIFKRNFFIRDVHLVAEEILGQYLVKKDDKAITKHVITEVEIYDGEEDLACHASKGLTPRTKVMYEKGGLWYVYLVYGMHNILNVVTDKKDYPSAVLIRGLYEISGPGRVTNFLNIDRSYNGLNISLENGLYIEKSPIEIKEKDIKRGKRIGVDYAGPKWCNMPWRLSVDEKIIKRQLDLL